MVGSWLGHMAHVRNWHGFGLGMLRSNLESSTADPVERLIRFMQAHGIDTSRMKRKVCRDGPVAGALSTCAWAARWSAHRRLRRPELDRDCAPPADVPEARLFALLQQRRRELDILARVGRGRP